MTHLKFLLVVAVGILNLTVEEASGKTLNLIDIYRKEVFDIAVLRNRKPVLVYFSRSSCTLCSRLQTKLEDLAKKNSDSMYLARVDLDKLPELKEEFGITAVPTTQAFYKGEVMGEVKGPKWVSIRELTDQLLAV